MDGNGRSTSATSGVTYTPSGAPGKPRAGTAKLGKVKIGAPVKVTSDSFKDKVYNGRVSFISSQAEFTPKQIQTQQERVKLVYRIKIDVENPGRELKSNMPVDAEILLGQ